MSKTLNMVGGGGGGLYASIFATGVSQSDTVTLTTPSGKVKSGKWTSKPNPASHGLPEEYQEVEYLESHGTEHIATNFEISSNYCKIISKNIFNGITQNDSVHNVWFGCAKSDSEKFSMLYTYGYNYLVTNIGTNANLAYPTMETPPNGRELDFEIVANNGQFSITQVADGVSTAVSGTYSGSVASPGYPLAIFCYNEAGSFNHHSAYKFKELIAYTSENSLGFHGISCYRKSDNKPGIYDLVTGDFLTNAGTGEFAVGPDVPAWFDGFLFDKLGELGTYSLTAIRSTDGKTKTVEILVDAAVEYLIEISFQLWLYNSGDQCEDITGGWSAGWKYQGAGTVSLNDDHFTVSASYGQNAIGLETNQKVSVEEYSVLKAEVIPVNSRTGTTETTPNCLWLYAIDTRGNWEEINDCTVASVVTQGYDTAQKTYYSLPLGEKEIIEYDISALIGSKYVGLASYGGETWKVNRVWLE